MYFLYGLATQIIPIAFLVFVLWLILKPKNQNVANQMSSPTTPENTVTAPKLGNNIVKIISLCFLGFVYFFVTATSMMAGDSCNISNCKILSVAFTLGSYWMLASFVYTAISFLVGRKLLPSQILHTILMPYCAIPLFIGTIMLSMMLEGM